ncbi:MAG: hypothetical protein IJC04_06335 [Oscillospiraceae bacterium]|nr:hypothetical protein [Oscillospiraceae bacterium]
MFGYVKPFKPHMRICEFEIYNAVYCGLCKMLGKNYGLMSRMTLSYDFAFLGLMELALNESEAEFEPQRCMAHPLRKKSCLKSTDGLDYTAAAASILIYNKITDDITDKKFLVKLPSLLAKFAAGKAYKKASAKYPELSEYISEQMKQQNKLEAENCKSIDRASEPSSNMLAEIASGLSDDPEEKRILHRFGYLLGRFIYIADAFDDLEKDFHSRGFNPLIVGDSAIHELNTEEVQKKTEDSINFTLGALADTYVQLELKRFKPITDNIVYLGLKNSFYDLIKKKDAKIKSQEDEK